MPICLRSGGFLLLAGGSATYSVTDALFLGGIGLSVVASLTCGGCEPQEVLVAARAVQGLGGAIVSVVVFSLIVILFTEPGERARAMGIAGFAVSGSGTAGVLLGGIRTDALS